MLVGGRENEGIGLSAIVMQWPLQRAKMVHYNANVA
jgi:hypothetical protein